MNATAIRPAWGVVKWTNRPVRTIEALPMECLCGFSGLVPCADTDDAKLLAVDEDGTLHFDPIDYRLPANWAPEEVCCPACKMVMISLTGEQEVQP